jgi:hypothetical protein
MHLPKRAALVLLLIAPAAAFAEAEAETEAEAEWSVVERNEDPVSGYVLSRRFDGSHVVAFRLETVLDVPPAAAAGVSRRMTFRQGEAQAGRTRQSLRSEDGRLLSHVEIALPLLSDRDAVLWFEFLWNAPRHVYVVRWSEAPDEGPAPKPGVVRMRHLRGHFAFHPGPDGELGTRVTYELEIDFGGRLPGFLVRTTLPDQMRADVRDLRQEIAASLASR